MIDIIVIFLLFLFSIIFIFLKNRIQLYKILLILLILFFIFQYVIINSNPYEIKTDKLTILIDINQNLNIIIHKKYKYPFILKPVLCSKKSKNVKLIQNNYELKKYLDNNNLNDIMYQEFIKTSYEVGILYIL